MSARPTAPALGADHGSSLNAEFTTGYQTTAALIEHVAVSIAADGTLQGHVVGIDQITPAARTAIKTEAAEHASSHLIGKARAWAEQLEGPVDDGFYSARWYALLAADAAAAFASQTPFVYPAALIGFTPAQGITAETAQGAIEQNRIEINFLGDRVTILETTPSDFEVRLTAVEADTAVDLFPEGVWDDSLFWPDLKIWTDTPTPIYEALSTLSASIHTESVARANADSVLVTQITTVEANSVTAFGTLDAKVETYNSAQTANNTALATQVNTVQATAESKNRLFRQDDPPPLPDLGDVWFDTNNENRLYYWTGEAWVETSDQRLIDAIGNININSARITDESTARASADSALASQITTLSSAVNGNTASLVTQQSAIDGVEVKFGVTGTINGQTGGFQFTGIQQLDGSVSYGVEINGGLLVNGTITADKIAAGTITATQLAAGTITADKITVGTITADRIVDLGIDTARIADGAVSNAASAVFGTSTLNPKSISLSTRSGDQVLVHYEATVTNVSGNYIRVFFNGAEQAAVLHEDGTIARWVAFTSNVTGVVTVDIRSTGFNGGLLNFSWSGRLYAQSVSK